ncbi:MAG: isoleucine--tRNA ligase [Kiritimatiellae bacterium]|nr:isoleucine--tRNA ligase [Kiritimatiellia bacterium]
MYQPVSNKTNFPAMELDVLNFWEKSDTFKKSLERNADAKPYVFYDGPPFATGLPHYGHLLAGTIKDIVPRFETMRGHHVERRFGWDCHGLPIEALAQEALGISGAYEINELGIDKFNEQCRSMVLTYVAEWRKTVTRMGRWVDFDNDYKTMDADYMESIWWVFKQLWNQGRVYKSYRIMPYSWMLSTPLSNFEAGNNYKDVQDPAITVGAKVLSGADPAWGETSLLIWTTTPWTLPGNLGICVGPEIDYVVARDLEEGRCYVIAADRLEVYYKDGAGCEVVARLKGVDLKGWRYEPIFPHFADHAKDGAFQVLNDAFVTTEDGTGLVHMAPAYGEDDFRVCRESGLELIIDPLDSSCNFTAQLPEYAGRFCKDCDKDLIRALKDEKKLIHQSTIVHSYPFCDRTDTPLIYRAIEAWYVKVEDLRDRLVTNNASVHWMPEYVGEKRFGNWLKDARDWNISRNRFWGSCIPIWVNPDDPSDMICVGSIEELEQLSGVRATDLHKHFMDKIVIQRDNKHYYRTPEVLDCWFESGAMPYAQQHYPFKRAGDEASFFPADFIAEGLDQTRGWFYTLMILGTCLFDKSPFKNVVVNGMVLAEDGKKMSKRLKNYPDPMHILDEYGADALRLYMIYSPVVRAENLRFSESGVKQILRELLIPWWNAYSFFVTYANVDGFEESTLSRPSGDNVLDRWIVSSLETLIAEVTDAMDLYDLQRSVRPFVNFVEDLTNWYIRRSRRRFWKSQNDDDKMHAYRTLRYVLVQLSKVAAPFTPFISESIYRNLKGDGVPESVHLCDFPLPNSAARDEKLERSMELVQSVVRLGRQLRLENDLKVRQPLAAMHVVSANPEIKALLDGYEDLITDELNIKQVVYGSDETAMAEVSVKADFRALGPRFGKGMKQVAAAIAALASQDAAMLAAGNSITFMAGDQSVELAPHEVVVQRSPKAGMVVASYGDVLVGIETALTPALVEEGLAREFISRVQALRKDAGFEVTQRIALTIHGDADVVAAVQAHQEYIQAETLCNRLEFAVVENEPIDLNGHAVKINVGKMESR